jgi:hypothetical protein
MSIYQVFCEGENPTRFSEKVADQGRCDRDAGGNGRDTAPVRPPKPQVKSTVRDGRAAKGRPTSAVPDEVSLLYRRSPSRRCASGSPTNTASR